MSLEYLSENLSLLKKIAQIVYDDKTYVILDYIINSSENKKQIIDTNMYKDLGIPIKDIRSCLIKLKNDGIIELDTMKKESSKGNNKDEPQKCIINTLFKEHLQTKFDELKKNNEKLLKNEGKDIFVCLKCSQEVIAYDAEYNQRKCKCGGKLEEKENSNDLKEKKSEIFKTISDLLKKNVDYYFYDE